VRLGLGEAQGAHGGDAVGQGGWRGNIHRTTVQPVGGGSR
jgi:hypothetical protein